jgi:glycerol-1-phosphate dehydrogenase [NAD(P)+]
LLDQPYRQVPFALLADDEADLFANSEALLRGDLDAMRALARSLVLSGFGMTLCGGSYPASQGEHLISHYAEMMAPADWPEAFHGEQIAVTTLTMTRLQERVLDGAAPRLHATALSEADVTAHFGVELGAVCWAAFNAKRLDAARAEALNARLSENWDSFRARLRAVLRPAAELEGVLARAGAPRRPEDLGWPPAFYRDAVVHAREIRDRYTFLDLAADSGLLEA